MADGKPAWRQGFDVAERLVGRQLEAGVQTEAFQDWAAVVVQLRRRAERGMADLSADLLHRFNLPAHSDLVQLADQVARLDRRVREIATQLERKPAPRRRSRRDA